MVPGMVELLAIACVIGILNLLNTIWGVCFVLRNKVDVAHVKDLKKQEEKFKFETNINPTSDILNNYSRYGFKRIKNGDKNQMYVGGELSDSILNSSSTSLDEDPSTAL